MLFRSDALEAYVDDVRTGAFPSDEYAYAMPEGELAGFEETVDAEARPR